jgi:hypothetical protein
MRLESGSSGAEDAEEEVAEAQRRGASALASLLPEAPPSEAYIRPMDAVVVVRVLCHAGRLSDALRWAGSTPGGDSALWRAPEPTALVRDVPGVTLPSCQDVLKASV